MGNTTGKNEFVDLGGTCVRKQDILRLYVVRRNNGKGWKVVLVTNARYAIDEEGSTIQEETIRKTQTKARAKAFLAQYRAKINRS